jgi:hypothetical protein
VGHALGTQNIALACWWVGSELTWVTLWSHTHTHTHTHTEYSCRMLVGGFRVTWDTLWAHTEYSCRMLVGGFRVTLDTLLFVLLLSCIEVPHLYVKQIVDAV